MESKTIIIVAVIAVLAVVGGAAALIMMGGGNDSTPDITYVLDGGVNNPDNPSKFTTDTIVLKDPSKSYNDFEGWYSDSYFSRKVTTLNKVDAPVTVYAKWSPEIFEINYVLNYEAAVNLNETSLDHNSTMKLKDPSVSWMAFAGWYTSPDFKSGTKIDTISYPTSDVTLYAKWDTIVNNCFEYSIEGTTEGFNCSGLAIIKLFDFKDEQYLMSFFLSVDLKVNLGTYNSTQYSSEWNDSDSTFTFIGMEKIDTCDGKKDLFVYTDKNETQWMDSKGIIYKINIGTMTLTMVKHSTFTPSLTTDIIVTKGTGVSSVTGAGTYKVGDKVTLKATAASGKSFKGFSYDGISTSDSASTITFIATEPLSIFALSDGEVGLKYDGDAKDPSWTVKNDRTGMTITTVNSNPCVASLADDESYTAKFTGKVNGKSVSETRDIMTGYVAHCSYNWTFNGRSYGCTWTPIIPDYVYYKNYNINGRHHVDSKTDSAFVTYTDNSIISFRDYLMDETKGMSDLNRANYVLRFVQETIKYTSDTPGKGMDEYWKYPYETLFDMRGDCEDSAILYAALMKAMGYEVALLLYSDHMATGIGMPSSTIGTYYEKEGTCYYYCETTSTGWSLGEIPSGYDRATVIIIK